MDESTLNASPDAPPLPSDLPTCHALLVEQALTLVELQEVRTNLSQENEELKLTITKLILQLQGHRRERMVVDPNQLPLNFGDDPATGDALADAAAEAQKIIIEYTVRRELKKKSKPRDERFPEHLPREEKVTDAPESEKQCPEHGPKELIGYDTTETLVLERPKLKVLVTKYPKYACPQAAPCGVAQAKRPTGLVEGNRYDTSIAAEIITGKQALHLPLYRQQDCFAGCGWTPWRSTLLNILASAGEVLRPFAAYLRQLVVESDGVGCDETRVTLLLPATIPAIDPDDPRSRRIHDVISQAHKEGRKSISARMWAYRPFVLPINVFDFTVSRHRDGPDEVLKSFAGKLMADCWSGFQKIELRSDARIERAACWTHGRRKVLEGCSSHPQQATVLLALIQQLYDIEERAKTFSYDDRRALRERESDPVLGRIREYLDSDALTRVLPKSVFAEAVNYLRNHWQALNVYVTDGRMPIDNNDLEQLMKQIAVGRKNWLFVGSVEAGNRAAILQTIVSTALRNDLDVWAYVKDVLDQLLAGSADYHSLRADVWKESHPEHIRNYRADERRDAADRQRFRRAGRRLARQTSGP
ncbi:MAG TPA: IS66 family transposase [Pirellulales bacterium]|nr:IS66 family transposase [Pirellulales bacterium]